MADPIPPSCGTTTFRSAADEEATIGGAAPSGRQKATLPVRAGSPGRNTEWQKGSSEMSEEGAGGVGCSAMADSSNLTSESGVAESTALPARMGMAGL
ncbi:hypothetical protein GCM10010309_55140 [Streptomyces violaceochromogenes]|nr:hypothetical protein GCM10010309_55140 [Streptomyces violaceochromogenes]